MRRRKRTLSPTTLPSTPTVLSFLPTNSNPPTFFSINSPTFLPFIRSPTISSPLLPSPLFPSPFPLSLLPLPFCPSPLPLVLEGKCGVVALLPWPLYPKSFSFAPRFPKADLAELRGGVLGADDDEVEAEEEEDPQSPNADPIV
jgi:hypothetical protein